MNHPTSPLNSPRIGAVRYLNARPLTFALAETLPKAEIFFDYPSRLAERLASGDLDVAMIPSVEYLRQPDYRILSNACIACRTSVLSVKIFGRVPAERIRTLALDEGSRTSAVLSQIWLLEQYGIRPELLPMPLDTELAQTTADAVLLIGDRGMRIPSGEFAFVWDLGECWTRWTGLPFVFALWTARSDIEIPGLAEGLAEARDKGLNHFQEIARQESSQLGLSEDYCLRYLRDHLHFSFGPEEQAGLKLFHDLAIRHGFVPPRGTDVTS